MEPGRVTHMEPPRGGHMEPPGGAVIGLLGVTPMAHAPWGGIDFPLTEVAMAGRRSPVTDIREILRRVQLGEPDRRIARDLGVGRNTVGAATGPGRGSTVGGGGGWPGSIAGSWANRTTAKWP